MIANQNLLPQTIVTPFADPEQMAALREEMDRNATQDVLYKFALLSAPRYGRYVPYTGTVPAHVKASRRAANKAARIARRAHR